MKKTIRTLSLLFICFFLSGCGKTNSQNTSDAVYKDALEVLNNVVAIYKTDQKFPICGGNADAMTMDAPGTFDLTKTEELYSTLSFPEDELSHIDDAASMVHMMNANTFTGACYHLTEKTDSRAFAEALKESILSRQWICGMPDIMRVIQAGDHYILCAYGAEELVETFQTNALQALTGSEVILEASVMEGEG